MTEPLDEDYLQSFAAEQQRRAVLREYDRCRYCNHSFHGLKCQALGDYCECAASVRAS